MSRRAAVLTLAAAPMLALVAGYLWTGPAGSTTGPLGPSWIAKLIDLATERSLDVDVGSLPPYASAALGP